MTSVEKVRLTAYVPEDFRRKVKSTAANNGETIAELVERAVTAEMTRMEEPDTTWKRIEAHAASQGLSLNDFMIASALARVSMEAGA